MADDPSTIRTEKGWETRGYNGPSPNEVDSGNSVDVTPPFFSGETGNAPEGVAKPEAPPPPPPKKND